MAFAHADPVATCLRATAKTPVATLAGSALGLAIAAAYVIALPSCLPVDHWSNERPLLAFAVAALAPLFGLWLDWARLSRATSFARLVSLALLVMAAMSAFASALLDHPASSLVPWLGIAAGIALAGAAIDRRPPSIFEGRVRARDRDRVIVEIDGGVAELDRRHPDVRDVPVGAPLAFAALGVQHGGDPFRTERRWTARTVLVAAPMCAQLRSRWRARVLAWLAYSLVLAVGSCALAAGVAYGPC